MINAKNIHDKLVQWIKDWFERNGKDCNAVLGLSGGKDSTICAALLAEALGKDRVIGVAMPESGQGLNEQELNEADKIAEYLGIRFMEAPIGHIIRGFQDMWSYFRDEDFKWSEQAQQNLPPRVRMTMLYAIAQTFNGRVCCCDNASENYLGYSTRWGDNVGDFSPIGALTVTELRELGHYMELPSAWVDKKPDDGLPFSKSDEDKFQFTYEELDKYIRKRELPREETRIKMDKRHWSSEFKRNSLMLPTFIPTDYDLCNVTVYDNA